LPISNGEIIVLFIIMLLLLIAALLAFGGAAVGHFLASAFGFLFGVIILSVGWGIISTHWSAVWPWLAWGGGGAALFIVYLALPTPRDREIWRLRRELNRMDRSGVDIPARRIEISARMEALTKRP
jgi:hypothetical protein